MPYPKLVRDRIQAIIAASGRQCQTKVLAGPAARATLLAKLVGEAGNVGGSLRGYAYRLPSVLEVVPARCSPFAGSHWPRCRKCRSDTARFAVASIAVCSSIKHKERS